MTMRHLRVIREPVGAKYNYLSCETCGAKRMIGPKTDTGWLRKKTGVHRGDAKKAWEPASECRLNREDTTDR